MRATSAAFSSSKTNPGAAAVARSTKSRAASIAEQLARREQLLRVGDVERRDAEHDLTRNAERLAARREHGQPRRGTEECIDERGACAEQVFAVVYDEQQRARREEVDERVDDVLSGSARTSSAAATASGTSRGSATAASATSAAPSV